MSPRTLVRSIGALLATTALVSPLAACGSDASDASSASGKLTTLNIDWATYNPLSIVVKQQGYLEKALAPQGIKVNWVQDTSSATANQALLSNALQIGSVAGSASLLARANGSPIKVVDVADQPTWTGVVVPKGSDITSVAQLKGKKIAAASGTDAYFFLVQALKQAGLSTSDVTIVNLNHPDGYTALQNGSVDAWAGLDPIMASAEEAGDKVIYTNTDFDSYSLVDATESVIDSNPDVVQTVVDAYEKARAWAKANPDQLITALQNAASVDKWVASREIQKRTDFAVSPVPGTTLSNVLKPIGPMLVDLGDVDEQSDVDSALGSLLDPTFAQKADPSKISG